MSVLAASRRALLPKWGLRWAALAFGAYILFSLATYVAVGSVGHALVVGCIGLLPFAGYVALRWPIYFPFSLYAVLVPLEPLFRTGGHTGATLTKLASFLVGLAFIARILTLRRALLPPVAWAAWAAFTLFAVASVAWSVYQTETATVITILVQLFAFYTIGALYPASGRDVIRLRRVIEWSGVIIAIYGIYAYSGQQHIGTTRLTLSEGNLFIDPNHFAASFILPSALLLARLLTDRRLLVKAISAAAFLCCTLNILLTGSRGTFIAIACSVVYLAIRTRNYVVTALMAALFLAVSVAVPNTWQRFGDPTQGDASGRTDIWTVGLHAFPHYWLHGAGFAAYDYVYDLFLVQTYQRSFPGWDRPSHNLIIGTAVELGIIGLTLVLVAWFLSIRQTWKVRSDHPLAPIAYGAEAACLGLFVNALSVDMLWFKYLWLALMVSVMTSNAIRARTLWAPRDVRPTPALPPRARSHARYAGS